MINKRLFNRFLDDVTRCDPDIASASAVIYRLVWGAVPEQKRGDASHLLVSGLIAMQADAAPLPTRCSHVVFIF
jgi:hypothetical protein